MELFWLCYSPKLNVVYCEPCWLFSSRNRLSGWLTGINDWQNLSNKINDHEKTSIHTDACYLKEIWKMNKSGIDKNLEEDLRKECNFWRKVLERLIKITLKLSKNAIAFRGHREKIADVYIGNFLSDVKLLAEYDDTMRQVLSLPSGTTKYLSPKIQNEIIQCLAQHLKKRITTEINEAPYFSIIADTTQDIAKKDQLSLVYRYAKIVKNDDNEPTELKIEEAFLGFHAITDQTASGLTSVICKILEENDLDIRKCRGQGYDGANTMSGAYSGVQTRIKEIQPNALYVHCAAHNINLVVNDAVNGVQDVGSYFSIVQDIYLFFGNSINRWDLLSNFTGESDTVLKKLNPTRWAGRLLSLLAVKERFSDILKALTKIILEGIKRDEKAEASRIKNSIENFEFVVITVILIRVLASINLTSKVLQRKDLDIAQAAAQLETSYVAIKKIRSEFELVIEEAKMVAKKWGMPTEIRNKRRRKVKKLFDELSEDHRFENAEKHFKVNVFYRIIDIVTSQLRNRFQGMKTVADLFLFLTPSILLSMTDNEITEKAAIVRKQYAEDLSESLPIQLLLCVKTLKKEMEKINTIREVAELVLIHYSDMSTSFSEVCSLLILFLTIPVTVATAERTFSKLKIIKNYLRNSTGQERLSGLALLNVEAEIAERMDVSALIDDFANMKVRKKKM